MNRVGFQLEGSRLQELSGADAFIAALGREAALLDDTLSPVRKREGLAPPGMEIMAIQQVTARCADAHE